MHIAKLSNAIKSYKRVIGCSSRRMLLFVLFQIPWYLSMIMTIRKFVCRNQMYNFLSYKSLTLTRCIEYLKSAFHDPKTV